MLIFGVETWVSTAATMQKLEGFHVSFLRHETGMKARRLGDENWQKEGAEKVIQEDGTKPLWYYINISKTMITEWVDLRQIFEVCEKETGYEGGGRLRDKWWSQTAAERHLKARLKDISAAVCEWRQQESGRRGEGEGLEEESGSGSEGCGKGGRWGLLGMMGRIQVTSGWADDPMWRQYRKIWLWRRDIGWQEDSMGWVQ